MDQGRTPATVAVALSGYSPEFLAVQQTQGDQVRVLRVIADQYDTSVMNGG